MRAAFHVGPNRIELRQVPSPALEEGEALVRVRACAFCGSDKHDLAQAPAAPRVAGHECSGLVEQLSGKAHVALGDPVIVDPIMRCGQCDYCGDGRGHLCRSMAVIGCQTPGGFAELVKAPIRNLHPKPQGLSFESATLADPLGVALHAAELAAPVPGGRCFILGAGTIGRDSLPNATPAASRVGRPFPAPPPLHHLLQPGSSAAEPARELCPSLTEWHQGYAGTGRQVWIPSSAQRHPKRRSWCPARPPRWPAAWRGTSPDHPPFDGAQDGLRPPAGDPELAEGPPSLRAG